VAVNPATRESTFAGIRFAVPEGCLEKADTVEQFPSLLVPHVPPTHAWCRRYEHASGHHFTFLCWDGLPGDRGPLVAEARWEVTVDHRTAQVSLATTFFRVAQRVLVAHLEGPRPASRRYLLYTDLEDTAAFERLLSSIRFVPKG
jgi:hypothetical protein